MENIHSSAIALTAFVNRLLVLAGFSNATHISVEFPQACGLFGHDHSITLLESVTEAAKLVAVRQTPVWLTPEPIGKYTLRLQARLAVILVAVLDASHHLSDVEQVLSVASSYLTGRTTVRDGAELGWIEVLTMKLLRQACLNPEAATNIGIQRDLFTSIEGFFDCADKTQIDLATLDTALFFGNTSWQSGFSALELKNRNAQLFELLSAKLQEAEAEGRLLNRGRWVLEEINFQLAMHGYPPVAGYLKQANNALLETVGLRCLQI